MHKVLRASGGWVQTVRLAACYNYLYKKNICVDVGYEKVIKYNSKLIWSYFPPTHYVIIEEIIYT